MTKVTMYSTTYCSYCNRAKSLMYSKGVEVVEIDLTDDDEARIELVAKTGHRTVPQIFVGEEFIGGFEELRELTISGKLQTMLEAEEDKLDESNTE